MNKEEKGENADDDSNGNKNDNKEDAKEEEETKEEVYSSLSHPHLSSSSLPSSSLTSLLSVLVSGQGKDSTERSRTRIRILTSRR